jgi:diguanylate cyclase (GGDEF)-like protein
VTVSLGVAGMPHAEIKAPEDLLARADRALYEAKRAGRNRMVQAEM